ncbi:MAG TPA: selenide, water dikinase SelD [Thermoleophilaceae bacterium]|nr:selenide, water dikinase SelD [Thermoleophilaceae bacterium]
MGDRTGVRLTRYCQAAGCAAKLPVGELERVLGALAPVAGDAGKLLDSRDDAGWIEFGDGLLLQTADFFTPIVDEPRRFGRIAAANALSDIYAMGGRPLTAMNLVAFPEELDLAILSEILEGGMEKISESGAVLCGGHSIRDREPKYGVSASGFVERDRLVRNRGAQPGHALVLTKPLGLGILTTALKRDELREGDAEEALEAAERLNAAACEAMQEVGASAATDVTGYGLLGHLLEMLEPDGLGAALHRDHIPVWEAAAALAAEGCYPGGLDSNRAHLRGRIEADGLSDAELLPLYDPQTSGGLLIAVEPDRAELLAASLEGRGEPAWVIGAVAPGPVVRVGR